MNLKRYLNPIILFLFLISGLTGLIYEMLWTRLLTKVIGNAPFTVSIILTILMGGMALGSYLAGKKIPSKTEPGRLIQYFGILELIIGVYSLLLPVLITIATPLFALFYNQLFAYFWLYHFLTFIICVLLLILPAICMGATLPILSQFYITRPESTSSRLGLLYGLNTLGAVIGSVAGGFWLVNWSGVWGTIFIALLANLLVGALSVTLGVVLLSQKSKMPVESSPSGIAEEDSAFSKMTKLALMLFAVSGFCAMAYQVIWTRLLSLIIGPTIYAFTIVVTTFIAGLAIGTLIWGKIGNHSQKPFFWLILTQFGAAITALLISQLLGNSQIFFSKLIQTFGDSFGTLMVMKSVFLFLFIFVPTFLFGAAFPLIGKIIITSTEKAGQKIGTAYSINMIGALVGAFAAGFLLIPLFGKESGIRFLAIIQLIFAGGVSLFLWKEMPAPKRKLLWYGIPVILGLTLVIFFPNWNRKMLAMGKYHRLAQFNFKAINWFDALFGDAAQYNLDKAEELVYFGDGVGGFTTVLKSQDPIGNTFFSLYNSGKSEASNQPGDMSNQTLLAHFPMLFHPDAQKVMVLGLASGITAGEVSLYPIDKVDIVEINQQTIAASEFFKPWNNEILANPKAHIIIQDACAHLALTREQYDVIIAEPSNPWMAGMANLYTKDFFAKVKDKLDSNGIFTQWLHAYQIDWPAFSMIGRTFAEVFPNSLLITTGLRGDYLLVGFKDKKLLSPEITAKNWEYAKQSQNIKIPNHRVFYHLFINENLPWLFGKGDINSDNLPLLEFAAPRLVQVYDPEISKNMQEKNWLEFDSKQIISELTANIDTRMDLIEYLLQFDKSFKGLLQVSELSDVQKERYTKMLEAHAQKHLMYDYSFIDDEQIQKQVIYAQVVKVQEHLPTFEDKIWANYHLGNLYDLMNIKGAAAAYFQEVLKIDPNHVESLNNLGTILGDLGKTESAIKYFQAALAINPNYQIAVKNLEAMQKKLGEPISENKE
ncbi:fused MFS/spermidine synthase [candidate division KSB1 bacterium]|nr:fused MFS/spermidine synthase [candidate division KSB1 bacterium]